ncbi:uncharacterized protein LOC132935113 [Metopolophium dirhodum]|uniref:uncharacterized protein LOC132935113 n=1 Tax=Metopolophium dirhodum TaxID=44670 RepID=UPI0029907CBE|nr:uncharacterized protein LOC132935113 [Metopolophium dirhodum]
MRKFLNNLQPLSSDKESLMGARRTPQDMAIEGKSSKPDQTFDKTEVHANETSSVVSSLYIELLTEDLTSEAGPSEKYWEVISERRRKALLEALEEHERLQAAAIALEEENWSLEVLMDSTTDLVNTLKEMINKETSDDDHEASNEQEDSGLSTPNSYSSEKHIDKKMKTSPDDNSDID